MSFRIFLKQILFGNYFKEEYICLDKSHFTQGLKVFLHTTSSQTETEITASHFLLGYKPLIIGFSAGSESELFKIINSSSTIMLNFLDGDSGKKVATLTMKIISANTFDETILFLAEGIYGKHRFLNTFHQKINIIRKKFVRQKEGNISLPGNLYDQVRIAYSVPRTIALVSMGDENSCTIFPTDLHGSISKKYYADSLRIAGKACAQLEREKKMVISEIDAAYFREAYLLGKNHTKDFQPASAFDIYPQISESYQIPLPAKVSSYKELELIESRDIGIHRIFFFKIINEKKISYNSSLAHIHNYYANWRRKNLLNTHYLFR